MSAAERITQRFLKEYPPSPAMFPGGATPASATLREHVARFDVVQGGRSDSAPSASPAPAVSLRASARASSWTPEPVHRQAAAIEQYRRLAAQLIQAGVDHGVKVVMIASAVRGEGKSLTSANLAVTLARSYQRETLLIDADPRSPTQHHIFRVDNTRGLTDWVHGGPDTTPATIQVMPSLTLMTAGRPTMDPMAGLSSARMKALIAEAKGAFDIVLIDTPPVTQVPDASVLVPLVDTALLVIKAGATPHATIEQAVNALGRERILGTVLNRADNTTSAGRYWHGHGKA